MVLLLKFELGECLGQGIAVQCRKRSSPEA
jgi:hypothetical protein